MPLTPEQQADIAQTVEQLVSRTAWPTEAAWAATVALVALGWYLDRLESRRPRSLSDPTRLLVWTSLLNGAIFGTLFAWACFHALDVGRITCIPKRGSCGGGFVDAGGIHGSYENVFSMYQHPFKFWFTFFLVAFFAVGAWMAFFWAARWIRCWMQE